MTLGGVLDSVFSLFLLHMGLSSVQRCPGEGGQELASCALSLAPFLRGPPILPGLWRESPMVFPVLTARMGCPCPWSFHLQGFGVQRS